MGKVWPVEQRGSPSWPRGRGQHQFFPRSCLSGSRSWQPSRILVSVAGRGSRERKRRRRLQASMFALVLPLSLGPGWALWAAIPWASGHDRGPQRRLLGILVQVRPGLLGLGESGMMSGNAGASPPHSPNQCPGGGARSRPCWEEPPKSRKGWAKGAWVSSQGAECITVSTGQYRNPRLPARWHRSLGLLGFPDPPTLQNREPGAGTVGSPLQVLGHLGPSSQLQVTGVETWCPRVPGRVCMYGVGYVCVYVCAGQRTAGPSLQGS